jgi:hypothetical protein
MAFLEGEHAAFPPANGTSWLRCWHFHHLPLDGRRKGRLLHVNDDDGDSWWTSLTSFALFAWWRDLMMDVLGCGQIAACEVLIPFLAEERFLWR